jgi:hypothetical protein
MRRGVEKTILRDGEFKTQTQYLQLKNSLKNSVTWVKDSIEVVEVKTKIYFIKRTKLFLPLKRLMFWHDLKQDTITSV